MKRRSARYDHSQSSRHLREEIEDARDLGRMIIVAFAQNEGGCLMDH